MSNQLLRKPYSCLSCGKNILLQRIDPVPPGSKKRWNKKELDGETEHICKKKEEVEVEEQQQQQQEKKQQAAAAALDTTTEHAIFELLQNIDNKLNLLLANQGVKLPE